MKRGSVKAAFAAVLVASVVILSGDTCYKNDKHGNSSIVMPLETYDHGAGLPGNNYANVHRFLKPTAMKRPIIAAAAVLEGEISTLFGIASPHSLVMGQFFVSPDQAAVESMVGQSFRLISTC